MLVAHKIQCLQSLTEILTYIEDGPERASLSELFSHAGGDPIGWALWDLPGNRVGVIGAFLIAGGVELGHSVQPFTQAIDDPNLGQCCTIGRTLFGMPQNIEYKLRIQIGEEQITVRF